VDGVAVGLGERGDQFRGGLVLEGDQPQRDAGGAGASGQQLREGKNEILGIVLNGLSPRRIEYYSNYRYYRSYKKYYGTQS